MTSKASYVLQKRPSFFWVWSLALTAVYEDMIALDIVITKAVDEEYLVEFTVIVDICSP